MKKITIIIITFFMFCFFVVGCDDNNKTNENNTKNIENESSANNNNNNNNNSNNSNTDNNSVNEESDVEIISEPLIVLKTDEDAILDIGKSKNNILTGEELSFLTNKFKTEPYDKYVIGEYIYFFKEDNCIGVKLNNKYKSVSLGMDIKMLKLAEPSIKTMIQTLNNVEYKHYIYEDGNKVLKIFTDRDGIIENLFLYDADYYLVQDLKEPIPDFNKRELELFENPDLMYEIDSSFQRFIDENDVVGFSSAVMMDGKIKYLNYGKTSLNGTKVTNETLFEIASLTKTFTGVLLADMHLDKTLNMNKDAQYYLGDRVTLPTYYDGDTLTLIDLITHGSTLSRNPYNLFDNSESDRINEYANLTYEDLYDAIDQEYISYRPGTSYLYSNFAAGLLGHIMNIETGKTYDQILQERICKPLGLKHTKVNLSTEEESLLAIGYEYNNKEREGPFDFGILEACGSIKSNTYDLSRYLVAFCNAMENPLEDSFDIAKDVHLIANNKVVGLGWHAFNLSGDTLYDHNGITPGFRASILCCADRKYGVVILSNKAKDLNDLNLEIMRILKKYDNQ